MTDYLPKGLLASLAKLPKDKPIVSLLRHAERHAFTAGSLGNEVTITTKGEVACKQLAQVLTYRLIQVYSSPVTRCLQTAQLLAVTAHYPTYLTSQLLGDPGIFITNRELAHDYFLKHSVQDLVKQLLSPTANPPGFRQSTAQTVIELMQFMLTKAVEPGIHLFITHDSILAPVLGYFFPDISLKSLWPDFLEGIFLWYSAESLQGVYRNLSLKKQLSP